jgi:hypothetical protein
LATKRLITILAAFMLAGFTVGAILLQAPSAEADPKAVSSFELRPADAVQGLTAQASGVTCSPQASIDRAVDYIRVQQQPDGSFRTALNPSGTADAVYALVAAGVDPTTVENNGNSAIDYIYSQGPAQQERSGVLAKFLLALIVSGQPTVSPSGFDFVAELEDNYNPSTGLYTPTRDVTANSYAIIALRAAGRPVPDKAVETLKGLQNPDGGWPFNRDFTAQSDTNSTAVAVGALVATEGRGPAVDRAVDYYRGIQNDDGGFPFLSRGDPSDANSTALSILALLAAGEDLNNYVRNGNDPVERLLAFQEPSGAFRYTDAQPEERQYATYQAVPALAATRCG